MLAGFTLLLVFQLAGEVIARGMGLPVPGPVIGMILLFVLLRARDRMPQGVADAATALHTHLSLLFVPAGVGVMVQADLLAAEWPAIAAALLLSTVATVAVSAVVMSALERWRGENDERDERDQRDATP